MTLVGCSAAFAADGIAITDHPTRKTIGFSVNSPTFEALTRTAFTVNGSPTRKATEVHLVAPRYYDSVFPILNAIDVDYVEQSDFDCQFKKAIVGPGADQNIVHIQRQNMVTDGGVNTLILSRPNAIQAYYGISKRVGALGGITASGSILASGGIGHNVRVFTASPAKVLMSDRVITVNRTSTGNYTLPFAAQHGSGKTQIVTVHNAGTASANFNVQGGDTCNGGTTAYTVAAGARATFISDGVSAWFAQ